MDLGAYANIEKLDQVMKDNGISVPRLRGLRLMKDEIPATKSEIEAMIKDRWLFECEKLCDSLFRPDSNVIIYWPNTRRLEKRYLVKKGFSVIDVRWKNLHGKKRKMFKFAKKQVQKRVMNQFTVYNKYCGQEGILYIHARIGGGNWNYFGGPELAKQPWFIEKVDDHFDCTYCDIYARIHVNNG